MIEEGALEGLAAALALHVDPNLSVGRVASRSGAFTAGCDAFEVEFSGRSGHSARPYQASDALAAACSWMQQAYQRYSRVHDCRDPSVVSIGTFNAGVAPNVIADEARLTGTVRTVSQHTRQEVFDSLHTIGKSVEVVHGCRFALRELVYSPSLGKRRGVDRTGNGRGWTSAGRGVRGSDRKTQYGRGGTLPSFRSAFHAACSGWEPQASPTRESEPIAVPCILRISILTNAPWRSELNCWQPP